MNGNTGASGNPGYGTLSNAVNVPAGSSGGLNLSQRGVFSGMLTGGGTLALGVNYTRGDITGDWSAFTGQINATKGSSGGDFRVSNANGFGTAKISLGTGVTMYINVALGTAGLTNTIGELSGSGTLKGGPTSGRTMTWNVGGANTDAQFGGVIQDSTGPTAITKSGTGTWLLTGTCPYTGTTTVSGGVLRISGSLTKTNGVTVAAGTTLAVDGKISVNGSITNNGTIRLIGTASLAATGAFTNNGVLDLINSSQTLPVGFVNNGTVLTGSAVTVSAMTRAADGICTVVVSGFPGHTYQLQGASSLAAPNWQNVGNSQTVSGTQTVAAAVNLVDPGATGQAMFYRVLVTASP